MSDCNNCLHNRVCGLRTKYQDYVKEFNELNKKYDIFERNPSCPEYLDKSICQSIREPFRVNTSNPMALGRADINTKPKKVNYLDFLDSFNELK